MKIRILRSAMADLIAGRRFYERQGEGLGDYFLDTLFSEIDALSLYGGVHRKIRGFHRLIAKKFPYAVYYKIVAGDALVFRILDCRQHPDRTEGALKKSNKMGKRPPK